VKLLTIDAANVEREHLCCALGPDATNRARAQTKRDWLADRLAEGLSFRRLDARGKVFVETMPIETCWKPVLGAGYLMIHCLWVSGRFQGTGLGKLLLDDVLAAARAGAKRGVAVVTSTKVRPFLTDRRFFLEHGFATVDTAPPYFELLALPLDAGAALPTFSPAAKRGRTTLAPRGAAFIYSRQCPFMEDYAGQLARVCERRCVPSAVRRLESAAEVRRYGSPFGTFGFFWRGELVSHELVTPARFERQLDALA
jgi:GNAT superfamily N-acetyltransferase